MTGMLILGKLLARESVCHLLIPFVFPVDYIRKHSMAHHDKVDGASQRKDVRSDIRIEGIVPRAVEPAGLAAPPIKEHFALLRELSNLEVGKLDMEILVEK